MCQAFDAERNYLIARERSERRRATQLKGYEARKRGAGLEASPIAIKRAQKLYVGSWDQEDDADWLQGWHRAAKEFAESPDNAGDVPLRREACR